MRVIERASSIICRLIIIALVYNQWNWLLLMYRRSPSAVRSLTSCLMFSDSWLRRTATRSDLTSPIGNSIDPGFSDHRLLRWTSRLGWPASHITPLEQYWIQWLRRHSPLVGTGTRLLPTWPTTQLIANADCSTIQVVRDGWSSSRLCHRKHVTGSRKFLPVFSRQCLRSLLPSQPVDSNGSQEVIGRLTTNSMTVTLKENIAYVAPFITQLFNQSLAIGQVEADFKSAYVVPRLKKPD